MPKEGHIVGLIPSYCGENIPAIIPEEARAQHTYIVGSSGYGKSELMKLLIWSDVVHRKSAVIVLDPSSDMADQIAHWPLFAGRGWRRLIYFHPKLDLEHTPCINPFEIPGVQAGDTSKRAIAKKQVVAQNLFAAFEQIIAGNQGSNMTVPMRALLFPCILALLDYPNATLRDLRWLMQDNEQLIRFAQSRAHYPDVAEFFINPKGFKDSRFNVTKGSVLSKLNDVFATGNFANLTCGKSTVDLLDAIKKRQVVVFNLGKVHLGKEEAPAFGKLVMALLQGIAEARAAIPRERRIPIHCFVDEVQNFCTPAIETILLEQRKFRLMLTMAQVSVGAGMSSEMRRIVTTPNLQITGYCQPTHQNEAAALIGCDREEVASLDKGGFIARMGRHRICFRTRTDLLDDRYSMSPLSWRRLVACQLLLYYRPTATSPEPQVNTAKPETTREPPPVNSDDDITPGAPPPGR